MNIEAIRLSHGTPRWRWPHVIAGAAVLLAHVVLFNAFDVIGYRQSLPQEIFFTLPVWVPPAKPPQKKEPEKPATRPTPLFQFTPPSSNTITLPEQDKNALSGLGRVLSCSNPDSLSPEERARCADKVFKWAPKDDHGMALVVKAPPPPMTAAEYTDRINKTADPCLIFHQSNTHVPECINKVIFGDKLP